MHLCRGVSIPDKTWIKTADIGIRQVFGRDFRREFAKCLADDMGGRNEVQRVCSATY
jgi:hypothetical protein